MKRRAGVLAAMALVCALAGNSSARTHPLERIVGRDSAVDSTIVGLDKFRSTFVGLDEFEAAPVMSLEVARPEKVVGRDSISLDKRVAQEAFSPETMVGTDKFPAGAISGAEKFFPEKIVGRHIICAEPFVGVDTFKPESIVGHEPSLWGTDR